MDTNTPIGLNAEAAAAALGTASTTCLADLTVFYMNARGFHWNIRGKEFFELHAKFEELYTDLQLKIDEVAERVLTLGGSATHTHEEYLATSKVPVVKEVSDGAEALKHCVAAFSVILLRERTLLHLSDEAGDEGTNALMSDYIREQEKLVWMYRAYLG